MIPHLKVARIAYKYDFNIKPVDLTINFKVVVAMQVMKNESSSDYSFFQQGE